MRWFLACIPLLACQAQQGVPAGPPLLGQIKARMAQNLSRLPDYTCTQSVERSRRSGPSRKFEHIDKVRLEVAMVNGQELYGWPGAHRIAEPELGNLVSGVIGTGDFGLFAKAIFLSPWAQFVYKGDEDLNGKRAIRYAFRMPVLDSRYELKAPPRGAVVGYHGSFWVDPGTLDLLRLDLAADDIPRGLGLSAAIHKLEYQRMQIGGSGFLLPKADELTLTGLSGAESRNRTRFESCHEYAGASVMLLAGPPPEPESKAPVPEELNLPEDFRAEVSLVTPIDSATAAVGDEVRVKLVKDVKYRRKLIAPKGALLLGRIVQLHRLQQTFHLGISVHALEFAGAHADLAARENTVSVYGASPPPERREARFAPPDMAGESHPISIDSDHLKLPAGFLLYLRSRLVKSDK